MAECLYLRMAIVAQWLELPAAQAMHRTAGANKRLSQGIVAVYGRISSVSKALCFVFSLNMLSFPHGHICLQLACAQIPQNCVLGQWSSWSTCSTRHTLRIAVIHGTMIAGSPSFWWEYGSQICHCVRLRHWMAHPAACSVLDEFCPTVSLEVVPMLWDRQMFARFRRCRC